MKPKPRKPKSLQQEPRTKSLGGGRFFHRTETDFLPRGNGKRGPRRLGYSLTKRIIRRDGGSGNEARTDLGPLDCYFPRRLNGQYVRKEASALGIPNHSQIQTELLPSAYWCCINPNRRNCFIGDDMKQPDDDPDGLTAKVSVLVALTAIVTTVASEGVEQLASLDRELWLECSNQSQGSLRHSGGRYPPPREI